MYTNSAYLHNSLLDIVDKSRPLIVTSCGTYKLYTQKEFTTQLQMLSTTMLQSKAR